MKIQAEIDIDWLDEEEGLDDVVESRLYKQLATVIEKKFAANVGERIAAAADRLVTAKTEMIINTALEQPITITKGWNEKTEYDSIFDMVEKRMTALYEGKLDTSGKCEKDPLLANIEKHVKSSTDKLLKDVTVIIERQAKKVAAEEVKNHELFSALEKVVKIN